MKLLRTVRSSQIGYLNLSLTVRGQGSRASREQVFMKSTVCGATTFPVQNAAIRLILRRCCLVTSVNADESKISHHRSSGPIPLLYSIGLMILMRRVAKMEIVGR